MSKKILSSLAILLLTGCSSSSWVESYTRPPSYQETLYPSYSQDANYKLGPSQYPAPEYWSRPPGWNRYLDRDSDLDGPKPYRSGTASPGIIFQPGIGGTVVEPEVQPNGAILPQGDRIPMPVGPSQSFSSPEQVRRDDQKKLADLKDRLAKESRSTSRNSGSNSSQDTNDQSNGHSSHSLVSPQDPANVLKPAAPLPSTGVSSGVTGEVQSSSQTNLNNGQIIQNSGSRTKSGMLIYAQPPSNSTASQLSKPQSESNPSSSTSSTNSSGSSATVDTSGQSNLNQPTPAPLDKENKPTTSN